MNEIEKQQKVISMRNGVELYVDAEKYESLKKQLETRQFIEINGELINKADVSGIFNPKSIEDMMRRKNGQWQCSCGRWVDKFKECDACNLEKPWYAKEFEKKNK